MGLLASSPGSPRQTVGDALLLELANLAHDVRIDDARETELANAVCGIHAALCVTMQRDVGPRALRQLFGNELLELVRRDRVCDDDELDLGVLWLPCEGDQLLDLW